MENKSCGTEVKNQCDWLAALHLVQLTNLIAPVGGLIGAFAIWKLKGNESQRIYTEGKDVLNFQVVVALMTVALGLLRAATFSAVLPGFSSMVLDLLMFVAIGVQVYFPILAIARISEGKEPNYPVMHRFFN